jgi:hypothetical protein
VVVSLAAVLLLVAGLSGPAAAAHPAGRPGVAGPVHDRLAAARAFASAASDTGSTSAATSAIVPGAVDRASLAVRATYDVAVTLGFDARTLRVDTTLTIGNDSGAGIDRLELSTRGCSGCPLPSTASR